MSQTILFVKPSFGDVSTLDPESLIIESFLKVSKIEFEVKIETSNEEIILRNGNEFIKGYQNIMDYIQKTSDIDKNLTEKQKTEIVAYKSLLDFKLKPILIDFWWLNDENYKKTKEIFFDTFLSKLIWSYFKRNEKREYINRLTSRIRENQFETEKEILLKLSNSCLSTLEIFLKKNDYFYGGEEITSFDLTIYGYLKCLSCNGFNGQDESGQELISLLKSYPKLNSFCERITKEIDFINENANQKIKLKSQILENSNLGLVNNNTPKRTTSSYVMISLASVSIIWFLILKAKKNLKVVIKE
eukprot:gene7911-12379_t